MLYNSILIAYFAVEYQNQGEIPSELLDSNIATDYGKIRSVFQIGDIEKERWEYMDKLMNDESVRIVLTTSYSFERGFSTYDFLSLLYYMGFLTIENVAFDNSILVKMPNRVIANLYREYFIRIMDERAGHEHDIMPLQNALFTLTAENNPKPILELLCENLKQLSHRDFQKMDEKHIQVMFFSYVNLLQVYDTISEYQSEKKYYDILMLKNGLAPDNLENEFLFEFKYARKATEHRLGKIDQEAITQVNGYLEHKKIKKHPNLHVWRIVIVGSTLEICEEFL